jgi:hypothetical protein
MSNTKSKLPLSYLRKNKEDTVLTKYLTHSGILITNPDNFCQEEVKNKTHGYNTRSKEERKFPIIEDDEVLSNIEYTKIVVKALKEALEENEKVSNK